MMTNLINMNYSMNNNPGRPKLRWVIEPENKIRFRYKSEGGSHGGLTGKNKENGKKTYPKVKLEDYNGGKKVFIRVRLHTEDKKEHVLVFKGRKSEDGIHYIDQDLQEDGTAEFTNLQILSKKKDEVEKILMDQKWENMKDGIRGCTQQEFEKKVKKDIKERAKAILNSVRLHFEAFEKGKPNVPLCSLDSETICNLKAASKGDLRIFHLSHISGSCRGGNDVILLCSKVEKDTIKVRFYELDDNETLVWEDYAKFSPADVHYQVAIPFKTPPYPDNVKKKVFICLERNEELSEPREFTYIPEVSSKKRKLNTVEPVFIFSTECLQPVTPESVSSMSISSPGSSNDASADMQIFSELPCDDTSPEDISLIAEMREFFPDLLDDYELPFENLIGLDDTVDSGNGEMVQCDGPVLQYEKCYNQSLPTFVCDGFISEKRQMDMKRTQEEWRPQGSTEDMRILKGLKNLTIHDKIENDFTSDELNKSTIRKSENRNYLKANFQKRKQELSKLLFKRDICGNTLLHLAVLKNKPVQGILKVNQIMDIDMINMQNFTNKTVLHLATENNDANLVKILLKNGSNPNLQDINGDTCFHIAAKNNCDDIMHEILKCHNFQPIVSSFNYEGLTPFHIAIAENSLDCFKLMKSYIFDPNTKEKKTGKSLLHYAVKFQPSFVTELLNVAKIDVDIKDFEGNTPLHIACTTENTNVVELLLQAGANPLLKNFKQKCILENPEDNISDDGQMPEDMTTNLEILKILKNAIEARSKDILEFRDCHIERHHKGMSETMQKLCLCLDEEMKWEAVANYFLDKMFIDSLKLSTSPTKALIEHLRKQHGGNYMESLKQVLTIEGLSDAVELIEDCSL